MQHLTGLGRSLRLVTLSRKRTRVQNAIFPFFQNLIQLPSLDVERRVGDESRRSNRLFCFWDKEFSDKLWLHLLAPDVMLWYLDGNLLRPRFQPSNPSVKYGLWQNAKPNAKRKIILQSRPMPFSRRCLTRRVLKIWCSRFWKSKLRRFMLG